MNNVQNINEDFTRWNGLKPVYFQRWVWDKVVRENPARYSLHLPTYQGQKVIYT